MTCCIVDVGGGVRRSLLAWGWRHIERTRRACCGDIHSVEIEVRRSSGPREEDSTRTKSRGTIENGNRTVSIVSGCSKDHTDTFTSAYASSGVDPLCSTTSKANVDIACSERDRDEGVAVRKLIVGSSRNQGDRDE